MNSFTTPKVFFPENLETAISREYISVAASISQAGVSLFEEYMSC